MALPGYTDIVGKFTKKSRDPLVRYGGLPIVKIDLYRSPVSGALQDFAHLMEKVAYISVKNRYDKYFHLYLVLTLSDGTELRVEKSQVVTVKLLSDSPHWPPDLENLETINVPYDSSRRLTLFQMLRNCINMMGSKNMFTYSAEHLNCQNFCLSMLRFSKLGTKETSEFIMQDLGEAFSKIPEFVKTLEDRLISLVQWVQGKKEDMGYRKGGRITKRQARSRRHFGF